MPRWDYTRRENYRLARRVNWQVWIATSSLTSANARALLCIRKLRMSWKRISGNLPGENDSCEKPQSNALRSFLSGRGVKVDTSQWVLTAGGLGRGEIEAMALYKQLSADMLLIDDHRARVIAEHNQINCIGALGLLLVAKQRGKIDQITPYIQKLRNSSIHYGDILLDRVLKLAGE